MNLAAVELQFHTIFCHNFHIRINAGNVLLPGRIISRNDLFHGLYYLWKDIRRQRIAKAAKISMTIIDPRMIERHGG